MSMATNRPIWTGYDAIQARRHQWALQGRRDGEAWQAVAVIPMGEATQGTAWQAVADGLRRADDHAIKAVFLLVMDAPEHFKLMVRSCEDFRKMSEIRLAR